MISPKELQHEHLRIILRVFRAIRNDDYISFFQIYSNEALPYECKHFMTLFFKRIRSIALFSLFNTYVNE